MTVRTTYGDLVAEAAASIAAAQALLTGGSLGNRAEALRTIDAYRDLLHALSRHGWALLGGDDRIAGIRSSTRRGPWEQTAVHLVDALGRVAGRAPVPDTARQAGGPVAEMWAAAAVRIRVATDLLATHRTPDGAERGPYAALLDEPTVRVAGLGGLAQLTRTAAGAADGLGLRAGQAGLSWAQVRRLVPATKHVAALSAQLHQLCSPAPGAGEQLANFGLARPAIRTDTPVHELADRVARLHRGAWELARTGDVGVASLQDYAALGVVLHGHAAAVLEPHALSRDGAAGLAARRSVAQVKQGGVVWQLTHLRLRDLRTATPGNPALRADLQRVRQLLGDLASTGQPAGDGAAGALDRSLLATLAGGLRSCCDIAGWNEHVLDDLAARGQMYLSATALTGDQIADRDDLIEAKLHRRIVRVPPGRIQSVRECYHAARALRPPAANVRHPGDVDLASDRATPEFP